MTWLVLLIGFAVGAISGVVGVGGGVLFIPALVWLVGMDQHKAQGTSLGALLAPVGLLAFLEYYRKGNADIRVAILLGVGFFVGGYAGGMGAQYLSDNHLRRIFSIMLMTLGAWMFYKR
ncbi:MAG: sulfite exporter TauE/SafE family protein [Acidobacteriaceae bacterium]